MRQFWLGLTKKHILLHTIFSWKIDFAANLAKTSAFKLQIPILWVKLDQKAFMTKEEWLGADWILEVLKMFGGLSIDGHGLFWNIKIFPLVIKTNKKYIKFDVMALFCLVLH